MKFYTKKSEALKTLPENCILANKNIKYYFHTENLQTFLETIQSSDTKHFYEFINDHQPVNMFFDIEMYKEQNIFTKPDSVVDLVKDVVNKRYPNFDKKFIVLQSHCVNKKSFHVIIRMVNDNDENIYFKNVGELKKVVSNIQNFQELIKQKIIDTSVYREGLFRTIHSTKENEDRPLVKSSLSDDFLDIETFVTHLQSPFVINHHNTPEIEITVPASQAITTMRQYINKDNINLPLIKLCNPLPSWENVQLELQEHFGFQLIKMLGQREHGFNFDADRTCNCPVCKSTIHDSNHWYVMQVMPDLYMVKNYSTNCRSQLMPYNNMKLIENIISMPETDYDYGQLFAQTFKGVLFVTQDNRLMGWQDNTWIELNIKQVRECLKHFLLGVLTRLSHHLNEKRHYSELYETDDATKKKTKLDYNNSIKAINYIKKNKNICQILCSAQDTLFSPDFEMDLNSNTRLLGTNNGVIDLVECQFREASPHDMVSLTVGYDFLTKDDPKYNIQHKKEFLNFLRQIYPIDDELEIMQRYCGYCLLGDHPSKVFLLLTDKRSGFNGKSTMGKMILLGMGQYARKGGNAFLYKTDYNNETIDSHSAGMLSYNKIRAATFEELDPKRQLDNQRLKDVNGGNSTFEGRMFRSEKTMKFVFGTKQILMFNDNNFPQFDFSDTALIQRILLVQHRSRFYMKEEDYEQNKSKEYTFKAIDLDKKLEIWRPYYLEWALDGLKNYWIKKFDTVPVACTQWRNSLVQEQDTITPFIEDNVERGDLKDFIKLSDLYLLYQSQNQATEKNKKTCMGSKKFYNKIGEILDTEVFEQKKIDGIKHRSIIVGFKLKGTAGTAF